MGVDAQLRGRVEDVTVGANASPATVILDEPVNGLDPEGIQPYAPRFLLRGPGRGPLASGQSQSPPRQGFDPTPRAGVAGSNPAGTQRVMPMTWDFSPREALHSASDSSSGAVCVSGSGAAV